MKTIFNLVYRIIAFIAIVVFIAGVVVAVLGVFEFIHAFGILGETSHLPTIVNQMAIALLKSLDLFLFSIVFFVFSFGILVLFNRNESVLPDNLPNWLRLDDFIELKAILWEAVLTTLVVAYFADFVMRRFAGEELLLNSLYMPCGILLISFSLYILKKK